MLSDSYFNNRMFDTKFVDSVLANHNPDITKSLIIEYKQISAGVQKDKS